MTHRPLGKLLFCVSCFMFCVSLSSCVVSEADRKSLENGFTQYSNRQFDQAQSAADGYIQKNPDADNIDEAYYLRGLSRLSKGLPADRSAATQDLQIAIEKTKRDDLKVKAYRALGDLAFDANRWQQAADNYQKSLDSGNAGSDAYVQYRIGACLQSLGQWDRAKPYFQRVASLNTDPALTQRSISRMNASSFSLQFGAFRDSPKAADFIKQLKTPPAGTPPITAAITTELRDGHLIYLVRSGTYPTYDEATAARSRLLAKYPTVTIFP